MEKWITPTIDELDIKETESRLFAAGSDGGYIGDGQVGSGADNTNDPS